MAGRILSYRRGKISGRAKICPHNTISLKFKLLGCRTLHTEKTENRQSGTIQINSSFDSGDFKTDISKGEKLDTTCNFVYWHIWEKVKRKTQIQINCDYEKKQVYNEIRIPQTFNTHPPQKTKQNKKKLLPETKESFYSSNEKWTYVYGFKKKSKLASLMS